MYVLIQTQKTHKIWQSTKIWCNLESISSFSHTSLFSFSQLPLSYHTVGIKYPEFLPPQKMLTGFQVFAGMPPPLTHTLHGKGCNSKNVSLGNKNIYIYLSLLVRINRPNNHTNLSFHKHFLWYKAVRWEQNKRSLHSKSCEF